MRQSLLNDDVYIALIHLGSVQLRAAFRSNAKKPDLWQGSEIYAIYSPCYIFCVSQKRHTRSIFVPIHIMGWDFQSQAPNSPLTFVWNWVPNSLWLLCKSQPKLLIIYANRKEETHFT